MYLTKKNETNEREHDDNVRIVIRFLCSLNIKLMIKNDELLKKTYLHSHIRLINR